MPIAPLSSSSDTSGSSTPRTRTEGATPQAIAVLAIWPMVSRLNNECWQSMKMKSWPVDLAMLAMSPERPSRTGMPSETPPACMRCLTGFMSLSSAGMTHLHLILSMVFSGVRFAPSGQIQRHASRNRALSSHPAERLAAGQRFEQLLGSQHRAARLGFDRAGGGVRRRDEGRQRRQGMIRGRRLGFEDVEARAEQPAGRDRVI